MLGAAWLPILAAIPALAAALMARFGSRLPRSFAVWASLAQAILALTLPLGEVGWPWAPQLGLELAFRYDPLARSFSGLLGIVGTMVVASVALRTGADSRAPELCTKLLAFIAAMQLLVLADNWGLLFVAWEATSIASFLLITFYADRAEARRAGQWAFAVTFLGGLGLLVAGLLAGPGRISSLPSTVSIGFLVAVGLAIATKSAQVPLLGWLPRAMVAPTPVSALLHSATLVQAGVYLALRLEPSLRGRAEWVTAMTVLGGATVVVGGALALLQSDAKRALAYATVCSLGVLVAASVVNPAGALAYFLAHGVYKSAMFLIVGRLEAETGTRDFREWSGLGRTMPLTRGLAALAAASMAALPFTAGFVAKESLIHHAPAALTVLAVGAAAVAFVIAFRVGVRPFFGSAAERGKDGAWSDWAPIAVLAGLAAFGGLSRPIAFGEPIPTLIAFGAGALLCFAPIPARPPALAISGTGEAIAAGLVAMAKWLTRQVQHGSLSGYIRRVFLALIVLIGFGFARASWPRFIATGEVPSLFEAALLVAILVGALAALRSSSRLAAVAALGIVGYGVALIYVQFGAPDLAMTQIAVETLTLVLFVFTFYHLPKLAPRRNRLPRLRDGIVAGAVGLTMAALTIAASEIPTDAGLSEEMSRRALPDGKGQNVVNVILVDFRGFDTLGEITVLAMAGLGVFSLLRAPRAGGESSSP